MYNGQQNKKSGPWNILFSQTLATVIASEIHRVEPLKLIAQVVWKTLLKISLIRISIQQNKQVLQKKHLPP